MEWIKLAIIVTMGAIGLHSTGMELESRDQITVSGPVEVRLHHSAMPLIKFDPSTVAVSRNGNQITVSADQPAHIVIETNLLQSLRIADGVLLVKLEGSERVQISQTSAPEVRVCLSDRARLDADVLDAAHLRVMLAGQGKVSLKNLTADLFVLNIRDESDIDVTGQTRYQDVALSDHSHYNGKELVSEDAKIALEGFAAGFIQATNLPTVKRAPFASLSFL
tara:strand:+ start:12975 stop:13640 length:666 start_codon:yes stop_codon:yes gene_type:complete